MLQNQMLDLDLDLEVHKALGVRQTSMMYDCEVKVLLIIVFFFYHSTLLAWVSTQNLKKGGTFRDNAKKDHFRKTLFNP